MSRFFKLIPLAMRTPNGEGIYQQSKIRPEKEVSEAEFLKKFADHPRNIKVSKTDNLSDAELTTAYSNGLDCWYTAEPSTGCEPGLEFDTQTAWDAYCNDQ